GSVPLPFLLHLIRTVLIVHVHILGVDHVARLVVLLRTARRRTTARARAGRTGLALGRFVRFVERFRQLVQGALHIFGGRTQPRRAAFIHRLLGVFERFFGSLYIRLGQLLAVIFNRLFGLINQAIQAVARIDLFHTPAIFLGVRFGFHAHFFRLFLGQAGRGLNGDLLLLAACFVFRGDVQDAVRVDVKGDFDLRYTARSGWNSVQLEGAERTVVLCKLALALHDVNFHAGLIVRSSRVGFDLARRDRRVARDLDGHHAAERFNAERKRRHV